MRFGHIVTVGTSLITNTGGNRRVSLTDLNTACENLDAPIEGTGIAWRRGQVTRGLLALNPAEEFGYRPSQRNRPKDRLPQELSYLWAFAKQHRGECAERDLVRFVASDTNESKNCGLIIQAVLEQGEWNKWYESAFDASSDFATGVDAARGDEFGATGIHKWMEKIEQMVEVLIDEGCDHIFLNVTGGYKGTLPYSTLMGMLHRHKVEITYLFEESPEIIRIPAYPVGLDFHQWHENALRLKMAQISTAGNYFVPDMPVQKLIESDGKLSAFGKRLQEQYEKQLATDPLIIYSSNIITRLLPETDRETNGLREVLKTLVEKAGDLIWVGDKIPEMVDHALKHHQHLLEFAELFLTPIMNRRSEFMNSKERFCLLAAILLHDCGHSLDYLKVDVLEDAQNEIPLFPSDIRDYHHFLTADRLDNDETAKELSWPGKLGLQSRGLNADLHDAVRTACLYHRRRTGYDKYDDGGKAKATNHLTKKELPPLLEHPVYISLKDKGVDLMKVVAFMRLIDGCDVQSRRVGNPRFVEQKMNILKRDYRIAFRRAKASYDLLRKMMESLEVTNDEKQLFNELLAAIHTGDGEHYRLVDGDRSLRWKCFGLLESGSQAASNLAQLWLITAELVDRADMKFKQSEHYLKHQCIREVLVIPADISDHELKFDIVLVADSDFEQELQKEVDLDRGRGTRRALIETEISSEYESVQVYSRARYGLCVRYWWQSEHPAGQAFFPLPEG